MVKFGSHLEAFLKENQGSNLYVVPYSDVRDRFIEVKQESASADEARFETEWLACLERATEDFDEAMTQLWEVVFQGIAGNEDDVARGASPDKAFRAYLLTAGVEASQELLAKINFIYETSLTNAEALRKLVKKFDKQHKTHLSKKLLPQAYASNFIVGQPTLEDGLALLRQALGMMDDFDDDDPNQAQSVKLKFERDRRGQQHDAAVERRKEELTWLRGLVASIAPDEISHIVAHRGFHNPMDRSDRRPLENSLQAYEAAWTNGIHLCECDIALTKDQKLVLAHDADFSRLALDKGSPMYNCQVRDLTFRELISMPLKSGIRPPLLIDVLRSARAIEGDARLIIEIKPGNSDAAKALARLFIRHPDLMDQCAVIMSFDAFAMHTLRNDLAVLESTPEGKIPEGLGPGHRSNMSLGSLPLLLDQAELSAVNDDRSFLPLGQHRDSLDHFGEGLSSGTHDLAGLSISQPDNVGLSLSVRDDVGSPTNVQSDKPPLPPSGLSPRVRTSASNGHITSSVSPLPLSGSADRLVKGMAPSPSNGGFRKSCPPPEKKRRIPKLMLLTVSDKPKIPCELRTSVTDFSKIDCWVHREDGSLDGVYLQFEKEMLHAEGLANLRALAAKYTVGVWNFAHKDPDDYDTFHRLVREGMVSYVNSDLPKGFKKKQGSQFLRGATFGAS